MTPHAAAELLRLDYREPGKLNTLSRLDIAGVQARIINTESQLITTDFGPAMIRGLLITGSNSRSDWHLANFRWWPLPHMMDGDTRKWHRGFWRHGAICYVFAKGWREAGGALDFVAGHSLGAAAAQITGLSLRLPTFCFASPKPLWGSVQPPGHEHVVNWCGRDDLVCKAPPIGFSHVGRVVWINDLPHGIEHYLKTDLRMPQ